MKSEVRSNLIFLGIFLALSLPGIVIMLRKASYGGGRGMMPPAVRDRLPYMDPMLQTGIHRPLVTPGVSAYVRRTVDQLARMQPGLASVVAQENDDRPPIMSRHRTLQLLAAGADDEAYHVALLGWNSLFAPLPTLYRFTGIRTDGESVIGTMQAYEQRNLPLAIREELQNYGYILPPESTTWMIVTFPGVVPVTGLELKFVYENKTIEDTLELIPSASERPGPASAEAMPATSPFPTAP